jgi:hypothetical protein
VWCLGFGNAEIGLEFTFSVVKTLLFVEPLEDLLDEEWIAFGFVVDFLDQSLRRSLPTDCLDHGREFRPRQAAQLNLCYQPIAKQVRQRSSKWRIEAEHSVAVSAHNQNRQVRD